jgi:hypothetical protein
MDGKNVEINGMGEKYGRKERDKGTKVIKEVRNGIRDE